MGWGAVAMVATTALSVGSSVRSQHMQKKASRSAARASAEAAKRNVTVQSSGAEPVRESTENAAARDVAVQNARKRRQGYASSVNDRSLSSSLVGNKSILGG